MFVHDWCLMGSICVFNLVKGFIMLGFRLLCVWEVRKYKKNIKEIVDFFIQKIIFFIVFSINFIIIFLF